ncbi:copper transporter [Actinospongicola halichondriae]|uniref:copper transporter n=1 Tax=Actinospongicola halichondriae TaxID=3236844 RepID=UPI003D44E710
MINLRYHIVSLTAVFLAIGIGLTLGSTFLDRATVDNFDAQLDNLQTRLGDREKRIADLQDQVDAESDRNAAIDEEATALLAGRLDGVPTVVLSARGVEEADVQAAVQNLVVAGADVQGLWWFTERWRLDDEGEVNDLAELLEEDSIDPSRLRRTAIDALGGELRSRELLGEDVVDDDTVEPAAEEETPTDDTTVVDETTTTVASDETTQGDPDSDRVALVDALVEAGFIEFEAVPGGPETPGLPHGTRLLIAAGSPDVPDDLVIEPLVERMGRATDTPVLAVVGSVMEGDGGVSDAVFVLRQNESLRELVSTVDSLEHFEGYAAMVLALADLGEGIVGHYGLDESASQLLPAVRTP